MQRLAVLFLSVALFATSRYGPAHAAAPLPGPDMEALLHDGYIRAIAQMAYVWGWPLVNMINRRHKITQAPHPGLLGGVMPGAPRGQIAMLHDYMDATETFIACPNQDVVYGLGFLSLDEEPVVVQVPAFRDRFWIYALYDARTNQFGQIGRPYSSKPGFYLLVGPHWKGTVPKGITEVVRSPTELASLVPRVFMDDTDADRQAIQPIINQIAAYPLTQFDGRIKTIDWAKAPTIPTPAPKHGGETQWVVPETFFDQDQFGRALDIVPPLPGEEALYAQFRALMAAAERDPAIRQHLIEIARETEETAIKPFFLWKHNGKPAGNQWNRSVHNAETGLDYFNRTATAKSNMFENRPNETQYYYTDVDVERRPLTGDSTYEITFPAGQEPPVNGFWSLTLYNDKHLFHPNTLKRYSLGTKNKTLKRNADGSLTLYAGAKSPGGDKEPNWLPAPNGPFSLYLRAYWGKEAIANGNWKPPSITSTTSDHDITDAYHYLLGRLLVLRQMQLDFQKEGFQWNELVHRDIGGVAWANPNLDVAYSEAWIAVDPTSCTIVRVPKIQGRYYTVQFLNGWGETTANINERTYPERPSGDFWVCLKGAPVQVPADAQRVDLPARTARVLARVELGSTPRQASALQHQITFRPSGTPTSPKLPHTPNFGNNELPGVEAFDADTVNAALAEQDINPGMEPLQAKVRAISRAVQDPTERQRVAGVIREQAEPALKKAIADLGTSRNGWNRPDTIGRYGSDYRTRTIVDLLGIWANDTTEALYFVTDTDGAGAPLDGSHTYAMKFEKGNRPEENVRYFWSVVAVDGVKFQVIPNPQQRFLINQESNLAYGDDGSLTLYFAPVRPKGAPDGNWLPTPKGQTYRLTFRAYGPGEALRSGQWFPAPLVKH